MKPGAISSIFLALLCFASRGLCNPGIKVLDDFKVTSPDNIFIIENTLGIFTCARYDESSQWGLGYQNKRNGFFTSVKTSLAKKSKLLLKTTAKKKREALIKLLKEERKYQKIGKPICLSGPPLSPSPTLNPQPTPTRTPAPTNTATICFTGDLSRAGCFGLPTGATGNKSSGSVYFNSSCTGCHGFKPGFSYTQVLNAFTRVDSMAGLQPADSQDLYNIVAYLNQFSL